MAKGVRLLLALLAILPVAACGSGDQPVSAVVFDTSGGEVWFRVDVADDDDEKARGLMGVIELPANRGMLFVWEDLAERSFYMKDTWIPLDLIAIAGGAVASVSTMTPCELTPCPTTRTAPAEMALEINAGLAARHGIVVGTPVRLEP